MIFSCLNQKVMPRTKSLRKQKLQEKKETVAEVSQMKENSSDLSLPSSKNDFFIPVSKKRKQVAPVAENNLTSGVSLKPDMLADADRSREGFVDFHFDLWTEAKLAAEENAQLCAGRPTHPFFAQRKFGPTRISASINVDVDTLLPHQTLTTLNTEGLLPLPPFYMADKLESKPSEIDWYRWTFLSPISAGKEYHSFYPRMDLKSLPCEPIRLLRLEVPRLKCGYLGERCQVMGVSNEKILRQLVDYLEEHTTGSNTMVLDEQEKLGNKFQHTSSLEFLEKRLNFRYVSRTEGQLQEHSSLISSAADGCPSSKDLLWSDIYEPKSAEEVCGNQDAVNFLNNWLQSWQSKTSSYMEEDICQRRIDNSIHREDDQGWLQDDLESDNSSCGDYAVQNLLLLTGPIGCGKSASVFACAREHGYAVIEVNASDHRSGALVRQKFGEAMESHRLGKWSATDNLAFANAPFLASDGNLGVLCNDERGFQAEGSMDTRKGHCKLREPKKRNLAVSGTKEGLSTQAKILGDLMLHQNCGDQQLAESQSNGMTVMLFEDVDMVFEEDRGFMSALVQLAETTKRPIILTSNKVASLPNGLDKFSLEFKQPCTEELVVHVCMICAAEGIPCSPHLIERAVNACHHDLRKLLMLLQFWSQGCSPLRKQRKQNSSLVTEFLQSETDRDDTNLAADAGKTVGEDFTGRFQDFNDLEANHLYELDAQHRIWPSLIPLSFPCALSQNLCDKINKVVQEAEERATWMEANLAERKLGRTTENANKTKKCKDSTMASPSSLVEDFAGDLTHDTDLPQLPLQDRGGGPYSQVKRLEEVNTLTHSPILWKTHKRQSKVVLSDSEDDTSNIILVPTEVQDSTCVACVECSGKAQISQTINSSVCCDPLDTSTNIAESSVSALVCTCKVIKVEQELICHGELQKDCEFKRLKRMPHKKLLVNSLFNGLDNSNTELETSDSECYFRPVGSSTLPLNDALENVSANAGTQELQMHILDHQLLLSELSGMTGTVTEMAPDYCSHGLKGDSCEDCVRTLNDKKVEIVRELDRGSNKISDDNEDLKFNCLNCSNNDQHESVQLYREVGNDIAPANLHFGMAEPNNTELQECLEVGTLPDDICNQCAHFSKKYKNEDASEQEPKTGWNQLQECGSWSKCSCEVAIGCSRGTLAVHENDDGGEYATSSMLDISDTVYNMWSDLRDSQEKYNSMLDSMHNDSLQVVCSLENLTDIISTCDVISGLHRTSSEAGSKEVRTCRVCENCSYYGASEAAAGLSTMALQLCVKECSTVSPSLFESGGFVLAEQILLALNDCSTLAKLITSCGEFDLTNCLSWTTGPSVLEQDLRRLDVRSSLLLSFFKHSSPRVYRAIMNSSFHEYAACLAKICRLEEVRQASSSTWRRGRRFHHYLRTRPWNLCEESISTFLQVGKFGEDSCG